jgi:two-component system, NtrC family, response regulator HydG
MHYLSRHQHTNAIEHRRVLVVSGDDSVLHLCSYLIFEGAMRAYTSLDPTDAFTVLANVAIGMVVTELDFPALTGIDLAHHVRSNYPETRVLVLTPFGDAGGAVKAIRGGADDFLMKPFSAQEFREKLVNWSERRETYSKWSRSQTMGVPETRSLGGDQQRLLGALKRFRQEQSALNIEPQSRHKAILRDAVRTLQQIIERDIEETALFANIDEDELRSAYLATANECTSICPAGPSQERAFDITGRPERA